MKIKFRKLTHYFLLFTATACIIAVSGCASKQFAWFHIQKGQDDLEKDKYECEKEVVSVYPSSPVIFYNWSYWGVQGYPVDVNRTNRNDMFLKCMKIKGWSLVETVSEKK